MGKIDYPVKYKKYNELTGFEKFIMRTCCYTNRNETQSETTGNINEAQDIEKIKAKTQHIYINNLGNGFFELIRGKQVLDFGCGNGEFVLGIAMLENCRIDGIDIWKRFDKVERYAQTYGIKNARYFHGNSKDLLG